MVTEIVIYTIVYYIAWIWLILLIAWVIDQYMELERMFREHTESTEG